MTKIEFTGCTTTVAACKVHTMGSAAGTIVAKEIPSKLSERETVEGAKVLADVFEQNPTTKEFATLLFEPGGSCAEYPSTKVKGIVSAECDNNTTTGQVVSDFPDPELEGNTLQAFGVAAGLFGTFTSERSGTGAGWGIRCV